MPAVIVECGFISNEEEAKNLSNENIKVKWLLRYIAEYWNIKIKTKLR